MSNFTIEELKRILAWEEPKLEDFHDNGGYDERSFEYQKGLYVNRQEYGKELLEALQTIEQLTAENTRLSAKIDAAMAIEERELSLDDYRRTFNEENRGANDMRAQFRKVLGGKE